jgi:uncharacterized protein YggE
MKVYRSVVVALAIAVGVLSSVCYGQLEGGAGVVQGRGNYVVKRMPETVRLYLQVSAKGKTLEEALANLKTRTDNIREQTAKLGGKADTVKFTPPDKTDATQQQQMLEQLRRQMGGDNVPKGLVAPTSVTVNTMFSADWPISAADPHKLLIEADKLQKKIADADLAGIKADEKRQTPEEREMAEEMETMMKNQYGGNANIPQPGTPTLTYVAKLSEADHDAAMAEGFKKARADAERLAKAAGVGLGKLAHVSSMTNHSQGNGAAVAMSYRQMYNPYAQYSGFPDTASMTSGDESESSSNTPAEVEFRFVVSVGYDAAGK